MRLKNIILLTAFIYISQINIGITQSINYYRDINIFTLQGIEKIDAKFYPCVSINTINDTAKIITFYSIDGKSSKLKFQKRDSFWINCEVRKSEYCCGIDSVFIYVQNNKILKFEYDSYVIAISVLNTADKIDFFTFKRDSINDRQQFFSRELKKDCGLYRDIQLTLSNGILEQNTKCFVCYSNRLYFEEKLCYSIGNLSLAWWFYLPEKTFKKMRCH